MQLSLPEDLLYVSDTKQDRRKLHILTMCTTYLTSGTSITHYGLGIRGEFTNCYKSLHVVESRLPFYNKKYGDCHCTNNLLMMNYIFKIKIKHYVTETLF